LHSFFDTVGGISEKIPEQWKQRLPGFFGLSLVDEQIFNSILGQLKPKEQVVIINFLKEKCQNYERNRFINIVAGMDVVEEGKKEETATSFDDSGKKVTKHTIESGLKRDTRKQFLESFAAVITDEFNGDLNKTYDFCIGGRIIMSNPLHQRVLRAFSESMQKIAAKKQANATDLNQSAQSFEEKARAFYEKSKGGR
jgi:hypothetical protein